MADKKGPADYRSSESGKFVKPEFAKTHPKTTEKEHNRKPAPIRPPTKKPGK